MHRALARTTAVLLVGAAALTACSQPQQRRGGPGGVNPMGFIAPAPTYIGAPGVPSLEGFSQAVRVGMTVYVSAQVPLDAPARLVGPGNLDVQTRQALKNLEGVVRAAHGLPADVVKMTIYVVNYDPSHYDVLRRAVADFIVPGTPPAISIVGVQTLPMAGMLVMVDAVATLRGEFPDRERDPRTR